MCSDRMRDFLMSLGNEYSKDNKGCESGGWGGLALHHLKLNLRIVIKRTDCRKPEDSVWSIITKEMLVLIRVLLICLI